MPDETEEVRKVLTYAINSEVQSDSEAIERKRLEDKYGKVWTTDEATSEFSFDGFMAPFAVVRRKSDNVKGSLMFQHRPRFYFDFTPSR